MGSLLLLKMLLAKLLLQFLKLRSSVGSSCHVVTRKRRGIIVAGELRLLDEHDMGGLSREEMKQLSTVRFEPVDVGVTDGKKSGSGGRTTTPLATIASALGSRIPLYITTLEQESNLV